MQSLPVCRTNRTKSFVRGRRIALHLLALRITQVGRALKVKDQGMKRLKHQLNIHLDWHPDGLLEVRYDYPYSGTHPVPEQVIRVEANKVAAQLRSDLKSLRSDLRARLEVSPIRVPHGEITPTIREGILTVVIQDQKRSLPVARLYCSEQLEQFGRKIEREARMEGPEFTPEQQAVFRRVQRIVKGIAWKDYEERLGPALFD
jgi:hypothetical protein